jgi:hypothetical protein
MLITYSLVAVVVLVVGNLKALLAAVVVVS